MLPLLLRLKKTFADRRLEFNQNSNNSEENGLIKKNKVTIGNLKTVRRKILENYSSLTSATRWSGKKSE